MNYKGPLYGKVAGKYIQLTQSTEDVDKITQQRDELLEAFKSCVFLDITKTRDLIKRIEAEK